MNEDILFYIEIEREYNRTIDGGYKAIINRLNLSHGFAQLPTIIVRNHADDLVHEITHLILEKTPIQVVFEGVSLSSHMRDFVFRELYERYSVPINRVSGRINWPRLEPKVHLGSFDPFNVIPPK